MRSVNPFMMFTSWYRSIRSLSPDKMILVTCDMTSTTSSRMVLLKKYDSAGFVFFTNLQSNKAQDIANNNSVSLLIPISLNTGKNIVVKGLADRLNLQEEDEYFATRGSSKQLAAWSSKQSRVLSCAKELEDNMLFYIKKFMYKNIPRPSFWGGFRVRPIEFQFIDSAHSIKKHFRRVNNTWMC